MRLVFGIKIGAECLFRDIEGTDQVFRLEPAQEEDVADKAVQGVGGQARRRAHAAVARSAKHLKDEGVGINQDKPTRGSRGTSDGGPHSEWPSGHGGGRASDRAGSDAIREGESLANSRPPSCGVEWATDDSRHTSDVCYLRRPSVNLRLWGGSRGCPWSLSVLVSRSIL